MYRVEQPSRPVKSLVLQNIMQQRCTLRHRLLLPRQETPLPPMADPYSPSAAPSPIYQSPNQKGEGILPAKALPPLNYLSKKMCYLRLLQPYAH